MVSIIDVVSKNNNILIVNEKFEIEIYDFNKNGK